MALRFSICTFVKSPDASPCTGSYILLNILVSASVIPFYFFSVEDLGTSTQIFQKRSGPLEMLCASESYAEDTSTSPHL